MTALPSIDQMNDWNTANNGLGVTEAQWRALFAQFYAFVQENQGGGGSSPTLYSADGTIADPRTVNLQNSLAFNSTTTNPATPASVFYNLNRIDSSGENLSTQLILADASPSFSSYYTYSGVTRYKEDSASISASSCTWVVRVGDTGATHSCIVGLDAIGGYGAYLGLYDGMNGFTGLRTPNPTKSVFYGENGVYKGTEYADGDAYSALFTDNSLIHKKYAQDNYGMPIGSVVEFSATTAPAGWLELDGSELSRTTYAALFAVIGETFGAGDGSTTFLIEDRPHPDSRMIYMIKI